MYVYIYAIDDAYDSKEIFLSISTPQMKQERDDADGVGGVRFNHLCLMLIYN